MADPPLPGHRLPRTVDPRRYGIRLAPDLAAATFSGTADIELQVHREVGEVVLNALDLEIESASFQPEGGAAVACEAAVDPGEGRLTVVLAEAARPGPAKISIRFSGTLNDKLRGFYRSTFTDGSGEARVIATTQFEATDARRAFPCWDEPDRKAVFSISLEVPDGMAAVSNTAVAEETLLGDGRRLVRFADTIPMSTYLVAFIVGPLESTDAADVDGVALSVVHVPGKSHMTAFALEVASHALRFFTAWFGIDYPGSKLDLVALPDFAFGAMENLGAVTFRESVLLVDPASASRLELERVADVVCHEIAHMWFGDLVTMRWWNGLWLNEAFATFMEIMCVDAYRPAWERWVSFGRSRGAALSTDGLEATRPVEFPVDRPEEAEGMFDILTYEKGAGVLRMLERYLGADAFRRGIRLYLESHTYANAETTDLWDAVETATAEPVRSTMDTWIFQGGYPLLTASLRGSGLSLSQEPFRYRPAVSGGAIGSSWKVPVLLRSHAGGQVHEQRLLLDTAARTVELPGGPPDWVIVNAGGWGFYRVRYDAGLLDALVSRLDQLEPLERLNLVSDTWAAALSGQARLSAFGALTARLGSEDDANVWALVGGASALLDLVAADGDRPALQSWVRARMAGPLARTSWEPVAGEPENTGTLRATLVATLGTVGADAGVRERARRLHDGVISGKSGMEPDLAAAVVSVIAATGGESDYDAFVDRFRHAPNPQEEMRYLYGLTGFTSAGLAQRTLAMCLDEVRTQNAGFVIQGLLANRYVGEQTWDFVKDNWDALLTRLPDPVVPRMLGGVSSLCHSAALASDVRSFLESHPVRSGERTVDQTLERLDVNVAFAERESPSLGATLTGT